MLSYSKLSKKIHNPVRNHLRKMTIEGKTYIKRRARTIPFGFNLSSEYPEYLEPNPLEQAVLEKAKNLLAQGCSYMSTASWASQVAGRKISHEGLRKVLKRGY
jgi:hypothetical protein